MPIFRNARLRIKLPNCICAVWCFKLLQCCFPLGFLCFWYTPMSQAQETPAKTITRWVRGSRNCTAFTLVICNYAMHLHSFAACRRTRPCHSHFSRLPSKIDLKTHCGAHSWRAIVSGVYERVLQCHTYGIYVNNCNERRHSYKAMTFRKCYQHETK